MSIPVRALLRLCHCCRNAVPVERDTGTSGGAEQRVCLGRAVQQVQPRDAKQPGIRGSRRLPSTTLPAGEWKQIFRSDCSSWPFCRC
jgi:hypothetical protein